jgi:hypothetical protein
MPGPSPPGDGSPPKFAPPVDDSDPPVVDSEPPIEDSEPPVDDSEPPLLPLLPPLDELEPPEEPFFPPDPSSSPDAPPDFPLVPPVPHSDKVGLVAQGSEEGEQANAVAKVSDGMMKIYFALIVFLSLGRNVYTPTASAQAT